jgi:hypothetical protein
MLRYSPNTEVERSDVLAAAHSVGQQLIVLSRGSFRSSNARVREAMLGVREIFFIERRPPPAPLFGKPLQHLQAPPEKIGAERESDCNLGKLNGQFDSTHSSRFPFDTAVAAGSASPILFGFAVYG